jgi:hypothetical protein
MILRLRAGAAAQPPARAGPPARTPTALLVSHLVDPPPRDPSAPTLAPAQLPAPTPVAIPCAQPRSDTALLVLDSRAAWAARSPLRLAGPPSLATLRHPGAIDAGTLSIVHSGLTVPQPRPRAPTANQPTRPPGRGLAATPGAPSPTPSPRCPPGMPLRQLRGQVTQLSKPPSPTTPSHPLLLRSSSWLPPLPPRLGPPPRLTIPRS